MFAHVLAEEITTARTINKNTLKTQILSKIVSGKIVKKYRIANEVRRQTGVRRRKQTWTDKIMTNQKKERLPKAREQIKQKVVGIHGKRIVS